MLVTNDQPQLQRRRLRNRNNNNFNSKRYRSTPFYTLKFNRNNSNYIFSCNTLKAIDSITINTTVSRYPDIVGAFSNILRHNFNKAEINEHDVSKGSLSYKGDINLVIHSPKTNVLMNSFQLLIPNDIFLYYVLLDIAPPTSCPEFFPTSSTTEDMASISEIIKNFDYKSNFKFFQDSVDLIIGKIKVLTSSIYLKKFNSNVSFSNLKTRAIQTLEYYKDHIHEYSIFKPLDSSRYTFRHRGKIFNTTLHRMIATMLALSMSTTIISQYFSEVKPDFLLQALYDRNKTSPTSVVFLGNNQISQGITVRSLIV